MSGVKVIHRSDAHYTRIRGTEGSYQDVAELRGDTDQLAGRRRGAGQSAAISRHWVGGPVKGVSEGSGD